MKRIAIATFFGLVAGGICATGAFYSGLLKFSVITLIWVLLNRTVMGFVIGVSGLKLHWAWNGIVLGIVVGSTFSYFLFMSANLGEQALINAALNGLFGLMIEFFTSYVFKQRRAAPVVMDRAPVAA